MSEEKQITLAEVATHNTDKDCWLIVGNFNNGGPKVYDVTKYLDDHPGGAEVLLDVAGQNADEFFEDIGHSSDAREELKKYLVGSLKLSPEEIEKMKEEAIAAANKSSGAMNPMVFFVLLIAIAVGYYFTQM